MNTIIQIYEERDSIAAMACGLGGGSLVNAGVITPTPVRARRNLKWPNKWERDWDLYEASASAMLQAQSVPAKFPNARIMEDVIGDEFEESTSDPLKLSINFDVEKQPSQTDACLACGNCLSGCPYNAKNSTDKNYIHTAIQVTNMHMPIFFIKLEAYIRIPTYILVFWRHAGRMCYKN